VVLGDIGGLGVRLDGDHSFGDEALRGRDAKDRASDRSGNRQRKEQTDDFCRWRACVPGGLLGALFVRRRLADARWAET